MPPYHDDLLALLTREAPASLISIGRDASGRIEAFARDRQIQVTNLDSGVESSSLEAQERHAMALVYPGCLEIRSSSDAGLLLGRLRDLVAPVVAVVVDLSAGALRHGDMLSYGFVQEGRYRHNHDQDEEIFTGFDAVGDLRIYRFGIDNYKRTPRWFGPRNWANPEQWDKHHW